MVPLLWQVNGKWEWEEVDSFLLPSPANSSIEFIIPDLPVKRKIRYCQLFKLHTVVSIILAVSLTTNLL